VLYIKASACASRCWLAREQFALSLSNHCTCCVSADAPSTVMVSLAVTITVWKVSSSHAVSLTRLNRTRNKSLRTRPHQPRHHRDSLPRRYRPPLVITTIPVLRRQEVWQHNPYARYYIIIVLCCFCQLLLGATARRSNTTGS